MRNWLVILIALLTLLCGSALSYAPQSQNASSTATSYLWCGAQTASADMSCYGGERELVAQHHHAPSPTPVQLPERAMRSHPSYFLHPEQQPLYLLAITLAQDDSIHAHAQSITTSAPSIPWFISACREKTGLIDNCKPANLTYRSRLLFELLPA